MLKLKMMLRVMMLPLVVGCTSAVCQSVREATTTSGVIRSLPDWQTPLNVIFLTLRGEADHYAKTTEGTQKYINEQCR